MNLFRLLLAAGLVLGAVARAADKADEKPAVEKSAPAPKAGAAGEAQPKSREEALRQAGVKLIAGPATVPLGKVAELKLPEGYHFVGPDSLKRFYELTQNMPNGKEVGVLLAPGYMMFLDYDDVGYVKDEDKDKLDADKLLKAMSEGQDEANSERRSRGWD